jgi:GT2 family glycosyltransferase
MRTGAIVQRAVLYSAERQGLAPRDAGMTSANDGNNNTPWPTVTVVFLAYNRREDLFLSLIKTLDELDYDKDRLDVIVVDNASTDGTAEMLASDFSGVHVIRRSSNCGVSGWNDGFAVATGDYVLALDDDCYLPRDGLRRAVAEAQRHRADLVSFAVMSSKEETHRFDLDEYMPGLFGFWGCAVLMRREILDSLEGYDPEIFVWANEIEFMLRFFDRGFRHLHAPHVVAVHAKAPNDWRGGPIAERPYRMNFHNWGYISAKLLQPRDAVEALFALLVRTVRDGIRCDPVAFKGISDVLRGFAHGLRYRRPVRPKVSRAYRHNCETFGSPWWVSRPPLRLVRDVLFPSRAGSGDVGRREEWLTERARYYPSGWVRANHEKTVRQRIGEDRVGLLQL